MNGSSPATVVSLWIARAAHRRISHAVASRERDSQPPTASAGMGSKRLRKALRKLERRLGKLESADLRREGVIFANVAALEGALGLTAEERELLAFVAMTQFDTELRVEAGQVLTGDLRAVADQVADITSVPREAVRLALRAGSPLRELRLLRRTRQRSGGEHRFEIPEAVVDALCEEHGSGDALLASFFRRAPPPSLGRTDFAHADAMVRTLERVLGGALTLSVPGVNVLIHGAPGVGKTELARLLAHSLEADLFEIGSEDAEGDPWAAGYRLVAHSIAQRVLARRPRALVLFDEMEDAFPRVSVTDARQMVGKGFCNRLLETAARPTLWLSNSIDGVDPAYLRRFDLVFELRTPPPATRLRMLARALEGLPVSAAWMQRTAQDDRLSPAIANRVARAIGLADVREESVGEVVATHALEGVIETQGRRGAFEPVRPAGYDLRYVRASVELSEVLDGLARRPRGTFCLHGPPGTGKTEFARAVAARLERPLVLRRASDLLGAYLGQTESRIAAMFAQARDEGSVLLLDEADGFLQDRAAATRSWEVTMVNELLVQMEAFEGIFFCTTNLVETLDPASLRRFDLKIRFDPPTEEQRWALFSATLTTAGAPLAEGETEQRCRARLARLAALTPGDFATIVRRAAVLGTRLTPDTMVEWLEEEHRTKPGLARRPLGFAPPPAAVGASDRGR